MTDHCDVQIFFWDWTKLLPLHGGAVMWRSVMCLWFDFLSSSDVASCEVICGTTPVLLCTTKTYNVLLQYYSNVLLRTTTYYSRTTKYYSSTTLYYEVLLCTTKYYSSTTLYYKVLRQYYSVLPRTTLYYKVLRQYYKVLRQYYNVLLRYYFETSFTMRGASKVTLQPHQILRLPRKMQAINDLRHIWNVISNARSK